MTFDWLGVQCALDGVAVPPRHVIYTVNGTGVPDPFGFGFAGDVGRGVNDEIWRWQPVSYPAAVFPMGPSVQAGVTEVLRLLDLTPGTFALSGYSQGALVTDIVWRDHLLSGSHTNRKQDCIGIVNFGDPMRCPGIANGNVYAGLPLPKPLDGATTGGIAGPGDLTPEQTPDFLLSFANDGDLYASAPVGDSPWTAEAAAGHEETVIFDLVQSLGNILEIAAEVVKVLTVPLVVAIPIVEAIINGLTFAAQGTSAPHWQYQAAVTAAVQYLNQVGAQTPARTAA